MKDLVSDIRKGNRQAFKELFEDYYPILCVFATKYIEDKEICKDIAQETLLAYWERKGDFEDIFKVKGFLYQVAKNRCLNQIKREQLSQSYSTEQRNYESDIFFEESLIEQETYFLVRKAVETLPNQMRTIIGYSMNGLKNSEIAAKMGIAEGTVHSLKKTAYRKLRILLKGEFYILLLL